MADALVQMAQLVQLTGELPANGGDRPTVVVTIAYTWLLDQLRGHGLIRDTNTPVSPAAARRLACDAGILPMILGGTTGVSNCVLLCSFHQALYERDEWTVITGPVGSTHVVPRRSSTSTRRPSPSTANRRAGLPYADLS